ncbi:VOC family protein [Nocardioides bizhenqiangii]|uniref:VOC family protein n=1 Tax=Nocardioides bizhenqiangii TaxID=3095076 RepID=A0ABZ0ZQ96_9ACTN|nr:MULTISPECIES: VOC family protein [unclassified Nocardioides]MDZ5619743.1 VOC family protein [Nocardioides sp. HM23]WQQ26250.1 VOC family protein [Nocardioides sp. HM61]
MTLTLGMVTTDTTDPTGLAAWWSEQFGAEVADPFGGTFVLVSGGTLPLTVAFQLVEAPTPGKNRLHLDLTAADLDAEVDRLLASGASLVERRGDENFRWVTLTDPAGNEFCVAAASETTGLA